MEALHLKGYVIEPTLKSLDLYSKAAVNLLLGTAAVESNMGQYLVQIRGPARGIYQMEPATHDDIWDNFLNFRADLGMGIKDFTDTTIRPVLADEMIGNLYYATAMARVHYLRVKEPLPHPDNIGGLASYWKKYYNTPEGRGRTSDFVKSFYQYIGEV